MRVKLIFCKRCGSSYNYDICTGHDPGDRRVENEIYVIDGVEHFQCNRCYHRNKLGVGDIYEMDCDRY
jgi:hypothetical protein